MKKLFQSMLNRNPGEPFISEAKAQEVKMEKARDNVFSTSSANPYGVEIEELSFEDFARIMGGQERSMRA